MVSTPSTFWATETMASLLWNNATDIKPGFDNPTQRIEVSNDNLRRRLALNSP